MMTSKNATTSEEQQTSLCSELSASTIQLRAHKCMGLATGKVLNMYRFK